MTNREALGSLERGSIDTLRAALDLEPADRVGALQHAIDRVFPSAGMVVESLFSPSCFSTKSNPLRCR